MIIDVETQKQIWSSTEGTNFFLTDYKIVCKRIADWILEVFQKEGLSLENLKALVSSDINDSRTKSLIQGLGLSGAEDEEFNRTFVEHFIKEHGKITANFYLTSDSVMTALANFPGNERKQFIPSSNYFNRF